MLNGRICILSCRSSGIPVFWPAALLRKASAKTGMTDEKTPAPAAKNRNDKDGRARLLIDAKTGMTEVESGR